MSSAWHRSTWPLPPEPRRRRPTGEQPHTSGFIWLRREGGKPMTPDLTAVLREHLLYLLRGGGAHLDFEKAIADLPPELRGGKVANLPHTPWRLLEHLRIAQW